MEQSLGPRPAAQGENVAEAAAVEPPVVRAQVETSSSNPFNETYIPVARVTPEGRPKGVVLAKAPGLTPKVSLFLRTSLKLSRHMLMQLRVVEWMWMLRKLMLLWVPVAMPA